MFRFTQECGETGARIESRETAPVDGAGAMDQRRRLQIAEQRVVFDSSAVAHAVRRTPRSLMYRRNIVSSRGARGATSIAYVREKSRLCGLAAAGPDTVHIAL